MPNIATRFTASLFVLVLGACSSTLEVAGGVAGTVVESLEEGIEFVSGLFGEDEEIAAVVELPIPIVVATEGLHPPFNATREDGYVYGLDIDLGNALCTELNFECKWYIQQSHDLVPQLNAVKTDMVISSQAITRSSQQRMHLSDSYFPLLIGLLGRVGSTADGLIGRRVGVVENSAPGYYAHNSLNGARLVSYPDLAKAVAALHKEEVEFVVHDAAMLSFVAGQADELTYIGELSVSKDDPALSPGYAIGVRRSTTSTQFLEHINQGLANLKRKGIYQKILERYGYKTQSAAAVDSE